MNPIESNNDNMSVYVYEEQVEYPTGFFDPVIISRKKITETYSIDSFLEYMYFYPDLRKQLFNRLKHFLGEHLIKASFIEVAGDGYCLIYAFMADLKFIGTFTDTSIEEACEEWRINSIIVYNNIVRYESANSFLPEITGETDICPPQILFLLSKIYSTIIILLNYENGVEEPIVVNAIGKEELVRDVQFILVKGSHAYGIHIPDKDLRHSLYYDMIERNNTIDLNHPDEFIH